MDNTQLILLCFAIAVIAFLYSSVGHAGASGYIATMTLFGLAATVIRPTALVLNILVQRSVHFNFGGPVISLGNYFGRSRCSQFPPRISAVISSLPQAFYES